MYEHILERTLEIYDYIKDKTIIIFGCGLGGKYLYLILKNLNLNVSYFWDNYYSKEYCIDVKVEKPKYINDKLNRVILIANNHYEKIIEQLRCLGYLEKQNIFNMLEGYNSNVFKVGKYTYGWEQFKKQDCSIEYIGAFTSIAVNCTIASFKHPLNMVSTHPAFYLKNRGFIKEDNHEVLNEQKKNYIGNDVWIGADVTILPGIRINDGAVIGAGAVVTKDVPSYAIVVGIPAHIIRYRFDKNVRKRLQEIAWWDWNDEQIKENIDLFKDIQLFVDSF